MSRWISIPNGAEEFGMMSINTDHIVVFYDAGPVTFEGDDEPTPYVTHAILADGSRRVFRMSARAFAGLISCNEPISILREAGK